MSNWSVAEQTVPTIAADGSPITVTSLVLRTEDSASHLCLMEMHVAQGGGYVLAFNRNGALVGIKELVLPPQNGGEVEAASVETEETAPRSHGRRR